MSTVAVNTGLGVAAVAVDAAGTCHSRQRWGWVVPAAVVNGGARGCRNRKRWGGCDRQCWGWDWSRLSTLGLEAEFVVTVNARAGGCRSCQH